jgi:hypothetical protein
LGDGILKENAPLSKASCVNDQWCRKTVLFFKQIIGNLNVLPAAGNTRAHYGESVLFSNKPRNFGAWIRGLQLIAMKRNKCPCSVQ